MWHAPPQQNTWATQKRSINELLNALLKALVVPFQAFSFRGGNGWGGTEKKHHHQINKANSEKAKQSKGEYLHAIGCRHVADT